MTHSEIRDALLEQGGRSTVETELTVLKRVLDLESRRIRRLKLWTIGVWSAWFLIVVTMFGGYQMLAQPAPAARPAVDEGDRPADAPAEGEGSALAAFSVILVMIGFAGLLGLPLLGLILLILLLLSPRRASVSQLRTSLVAIESRLKEAAAMQVPPSS